MTRQQIIRGSELSPPTVGNYIKQLDAMGLIEEVKLEGGRSQIGRKASGLSIKADARYALGVEIRKDLFKLFLTDIYGHVVGSSFSETAFSAEEMYLRPLAGRIEALLDQEHIDRSRVVGVGLAITSRVFEDTGLLSSYVLGIDKVSFLGFSKYIPYPISVRQIASAALFANVQRRKEHENLAYIWIGEVLAASVTLHHDFYYGKNSLGMEINHLCMERNGRLHSCGKRGCLGAYCSSDRLGGGLFGSLDAFFAALDAGDPLAEREWEVYLDILSMAINNIHLILDCDIVLGGPVGCRMAGRVSDIEERIKEMDPYWRDDDAILIDDDEDSPAVGGALTVLTDFISAL